MKRILSLLAICSTLYSFAQQDPYYTHFKDVMQAYNPAAAGHEYGEICVSGLTHHQWRDFNDETAARGTNGEPGSGIQNVAPVTYNFNVGTVFNLDAGKTKQLGAGLSIIDDQIGFTKSTSIMANLNYRMLFQGGYQSLSIGTGIGATQWGWTQPKYVWRQDNDEKIPVSGSNQMLLDLNLGAMFKQKSLGPIDNFYAGFSMTNVNQANYKVNVLTAAGTQANLTRKYVPHYYTIAGGEFGSNIIYEPAILLKYGLLAKAYRPQIDLNFTALMANKFRGGLAYRQWGVSDAVSVLLGYQKNNLKVGYSYDITLSNVQRVSNGTHEIFVRYCIPIKIATSEEIIRESVRFL